MGNPYEDAANNTAKRAGIETDNELIQYGQLQDYHFRGLERRYGFEQVRRYITLMEARKAGIPRLFRSKDG